MKTVNLGTVTTTGATSSVIVSSEAPQFAVQMIASGDPTAIVADFEVSLDGANWGAASTLTFDAGNLSSLGKFSYVIDTPAPYVRLNFTTVTFTTTGDVTALIRWDNN